MIRIKVKKSFLLVAPDGKTTHFLKGEHLVDEDTANHWYVREMSEVIADESEETETDETETPEETPRPETKRKRK
jgi:hypothetical protein